MRHPVCHYICSTVALAAIVIAFQSPQQLAPFRHHQSHQSRSSHHALHASSPLLACNGILLLSDADVTTDTYHALNGAMMSGATDSAISTSSSAGLDPSLALAGAVAAAALIGILTLSMKDDDDDKDAETTRTSASQLYPTSKGAASDEKAAVVLAVEDTKDDPEEEPAPPLKEGEEDEDTFDDVQESRQALAAFDQGSRSGLLSSLGRLTGLVRSTRRSLDEETQLRQQAEATLQLVGEELRDVEDQYELGQNELAKTTQQLQSTTSDLVHTQQQLETTRASLEVLQQERTSLRKLGAVAWRLSKDRVQTRIRRIRGNRAKDKVGSDSDATDTEEA